MFLADNVGSSEQITQTLTTNQKFDINILIQCLFSFSSEEILKLVCTFPTLFHVQTFFMYLHKFNWYDLSV